MWFKSELEYINQQKAIYKSLKPCYCEAIKQTVYFTSDGLNHLLYNRRRPRKLKERKYRAALINYIVEVITDAKTAQKTDVAGSKDSLWVLEHEVKIKWKGRKQIIKVILKKEGAGNVKFLSAMSK